jgi:hypothetical protein
MSGVAAWATLTPSVTKSTTNMAVFPTPIPGNPIPPGGVVSSSQTVNSKTTNSSQLGAFATGFLSSSLSYEGQVTGVPTTDWQAYNAASDVISDFVHEMQCPASSSSSPSLIAVPTPCLQILSGEHVNL